MRLCERAIEHDAICEKAFRLAMLCCYALGRQEEALRTFQRCSKALAQELIARRLLIEQTGELRFPHDLVCQTIYSSISAPRRETLHRQVLRALEAEGASMAELASHALAGGVWTSTVRYATAAGNQAKECIK